MPRRQIPAIVSAPQLAEAVASDPEIRLLDVRTPAEFGRAHVDGSYNVPLNELEQHAAELRQILAPVVLVCRSDARARRAEQALRRAGMRNVHVLEGGILSWQRQGLPVSRRPVSLGGVVRRLAGVAAIGLAAIYARENPLLGMVLVFMGVRLALGQSVLPCAGGACALPGSDTTTNVRALVEGADRV